jgi:superfamily I DNA and/or RNA helicase
MKNGNTSEFMDMLYYENLPENTELLRKNIATYYGRFIYFLRKYQRFILDRSKMIKITWEKVNETEVGKQSDHRGLLAIKLIFPNVQDEIQKWFISEVQRLIFAGLIKNLEYKNTNSNKRIEIKESDELEGIVFVKELPTSTELYPVDRDFRVDKEIKALQKLIDSPEPHHLPLLKLAGPRNSNNWNNLGMSKVKKWKLLNNKNVKGTESQRKIVEVALNTPDFAILEGPPGSGKTTAISELIYQLLSSGKHVLLVGSTHVSVDNVLEKLVKYDDVIVPIRMAPKDRSLPEKIMELTFSNYVSSLKKEIIRRLSDKQEKDEIVREWIHILEGSTSDNVLENVISDSINLVCGTTMGVLSYPAIRETLKKKEFSKLFDVMIIDEASKTTMVEFLVPAMLCEKWVISGDPQQLSPFVDSELVESQILEVFTETYGEYQNSFRPMESDEKPLDKREFEQIILDAFLANDTILHKIGNTRASALVEINMGNRVINYVSRQINAFNPDLIVSIPTETNDTYKVCWEINASDVIIANKLFFNKYEDCLPYDALPVLEDFRKLKHKFRSRLIGVRDGYEWRNMNIPDLSRESPFTTLAHEVTWRLIRMYELRKNPERRNAFKAQISHLFPLWDASMKYPEREIEQVKKISLPSIIELLVDGTMDFPKSDSPILEAGFGEDVLNAIRVRLEYQHRMHQDISDVARRISYTDSSGREYALMNDPDLNREWSYGRYPNHIAWIHVDGPEIVNKGRGVYNENEIRWVMRELREFLKWAERSPKNQERPWEIAILSFYENQTRMIEGEVRNLFHKNGNSFTHQNSGTIIHVGNVDSMQGKEADVVFLSMVRTKRRGFLDNLNRINVAITRAKYQLVIIGDHNFFIRQKDKSLAVYKLASLVTASYDYSNRRLENDR